MDAEVLRGRLAAFLPRSIWALIGGAAASRRAHGCVLFADLAGFTRLTESLAMIGKEGAEELTRILNDFFMAMIRIVHSEGGDVLRFGGDAMTLFFPAGMKSGLRAALLMQREAARFQSISTRGGTFALGMKIGVSSGSVLLGLVGDQEVGRDYFAAGGALDSAAEAEHHATRGQIAVSPAGLRELKDGLGGLEILEDGFGLVGDPSSFAEPEGGFGESATREALPQGAEAETFLPRFIARKVRAVEGLSVAEHRRTTVLFLSFSGLDYDGDPDVLPKVDEAFRRIAATVRQFGGVVNKIDMGDKGSKVIALFGAPFALEHQEEAACRAAMTILADSGLRALLSDVRIGITVAPLFAAYVGSDERREFTVMGDGINMSARLMANAHAWRVICSREVMEQAAHALAFRELDPVFVKGKSDKVAIFRPEGDREAESVMRASFVGRRELVEALRPRLVETSSPVLLAVVGDPGVGKSAFLHRLGLAMDEAGIRHVTVPLVAHSVHSYMAAWRNVFFTALGVARGAPAHIREAALRAAMAREDPGYLPLFNGLLGANLPESEASEALSAKDRKDVLFAMLTRLFLGQAGDGPYGIFLDQLEYADPASLEFLQALVGEVGDRPLKLLVAYRSHAKEVLADALSAFEPLELGPLAQDETKAFLVHAAGMAPPTETFLGFIQKKTGGNPKFLQQFLSVMEKEGLAAVGPSGLLEVDEDRLAAASFPDTLEGLLLSRVDALPEHERAFLKAASVLGASFSLNLLQTLTEEGQGAMLEAIRSLEEKGIIRMDTWGARPYATFTDSLLRDALYESLNFSTKRAFHARVADLLERQGGQEPRLWPALALHFEAAGEEAKASFYLWSAAEDARSRYDNTSAFELLSRYVALGERARASVAEDGQFRKGLLHLAEASKDLGRLDEAGAFSKRIIAETPHPCPETVVSLMRLADNHRLRGKIDEALDLFEKAHQQAVDMKDQVLQCRVHVGWGVPFAMIGNWDEAMARFKRAELLARKNKAYPYLAYALMNQGLVHYHGTGRYRDALTVLRRARRVATVHGLKPYLVNISLNLGQVLFELGKYKEALDAATEGSVIAKQFGYRNLLLALLGNKLLSLVALGRWDETESELQPVAHLARHFEMSPYVAHSHYINGILAAVRGSYSDSFSCQSQAFDIYQDGHMISQALGCLNEMVTMALLLSLPELAKSTLERGGESIRAGLEHGEDLWSIGLRVQDCLTRYSLGTISRDEVRASAQQALASAEKAGALWLVAEIGETLIRFLARDGLQEEAVTLGQRLSPMLSRHRSAWKGAPFFLAFAEVLLSAGSEAEAQEVAVHLKRYRGSLDRGLLGLRYRLLLARLARTAGRKHAMQRQRKEAARIAKEITLLPNGPEIRSALLALPEMREALDERQ